MKQSVDLERLFKLRLLVARQGEMDLAKWWNTQGLLGPRGGLVLKRGFPTTHYFAQARLVFKVAKMRCHELFDPPGCMTLWSLPAELEDQFEERWHDWLDDLDAWTPFFETVAKLDGDLLGALRQHSLITAEQNEAVGRLRRSAENRAVPLSGVHPPSDDVLGMLAAAFSRGEPGSPAIPYVRLEG
jgi:hypothetical protein